MSRPARLLQLLDALRRARLPQTGPQLAQQLGVSLRTIYRDIATLRTQGADILGDPGLGFEMRPGFLLPPLMFNVDELEALLLGASWASLQADPQLAQAAQAAMDRIPAACWCPICSHHPRRKKLGRPPCVGRFAQSTKSCCTTRINMARLHSAKSGRLPWLILSEPE